MKSQKKHQIARIIIVILLSLFIGIGCYYYNACYVVGNRLPMPFGVGVSIIMSGSMEPTLSVDDLVVIKQAENYEPDDIVVYQDGSMLVIHRLMEVNGETAVTKGDANNRTDDPIDVSSIKGKLVFSIPYVGTAIRAIRSPIGIAIVVILAIFLLIRSKRNEENVVDNEEKSLKDEIEALKKQLEQKDEDDGEQSS